MRAPPIRTSQVAGEDFLSKLAAQRPLQERVLLVFAHPDDETIGTAGILPLLHEPMLVIATDGAPPDNRDAERLKLTRAAYAEMRRHELEAALEHAGCDLVRLMRLDLPDGHVIEHVEKLAAILMATMIEQQSEIVMTHAYEGGHPDHDAVALAVHLACRRLDAAPDIIEIPFYHAGPRGWVLQSFADDLPKPMRIRLSAANWKRKCAMLDAHRSQSDLLLFFRQPFETFRCAHDHDFSELPNDGRLLYGDVAPSLSPGDWLDAARRCLRALA